MSRLDCLNGTQRFLIEAALAQCSGVQQLARICQVHPRTVRDWRREKHRMSFEAFQRVAERTGMRCGMTFNVLPEFWHIGRAARLGGQRSYQLYGPPPASLESRRKGGLSTIEKFRRNPELARLVGFQLRKPIKKPRRSTLLAELIGIMLGDGCLAGRYQASVSFNSQTDREYSRYLEELLQRLFGVAATITYRPGTRGGSVTVSSRAVVEYLQVQGLRNGSKVFHQVDVPKWIWGKPGYRRACLRGLMDTDGSIYGYTHQVYGRMYRHAALCFANRSLPLLRSVERLLLEEDFRPRTKQYQVYLHRQKEIQRYFRRVGSSNPKHLTRYQRIIATQH